MSRITSSIGESGQTIESFEKPFYDSGTVIRIFRSEEEYKDWFENGPKRHCRWIIKEKKIFDSAKFPTDVHKIVRIVCDHSGKRRIPKKSGKESELAKKPRKVKKSSKKVGCTVRLQRNYLVNGMVKISYYWKHRNHDPTDDIESHQNTLSVDSNA